MTPVEQLGRNLAMARTRGTPFDRAWPGALEGVLADVEGKDRGDWLEVLNATAEAWEAAWERRPPTRAQRALIAVAEDPERVPLADPPLRLAA